MKFGRSLPDELADSKDVDKGFYIDIGANDPTNLSVIKFFYDRDRHIINIEPLIDKCALLSEMRSRDMNLCVDLSRRIRLFR